ncbi:MAG: hydrogenobyrinic acid a,c-diamide synthase (glutamine-hydrolyzing) [Methanocalculus sp. MSAO_Arc2]|uniref:cobyrinate a,c-diamide synthase n=1 Tax=Methanocalculus sp. MSAO_Arc2 TaxID=2293855 RepID=UPI000FEF0403|nr:MAG: hydrogenobyrinic acid a,c-diamide synthase (glutamine-hydrolyzing) [Methanocalculus sp. MSAO_Arc2]
MPETKIRIPRIIIAGTHSGCGKTTIATGLMGALTARGLTVQPFKVGPDFIDPTHHTEICGRGSLNLDPYIMGEDEVIRTFMRASEGADIAVIEGVMGLYDGIDGTGESSTAHVARILSCPVILVCDVKGMSRSVHALILGYTTYDPDIFFAGVIYNRGGSDRHRKMIGNAQNLQSLGWIPRRDELLVKSRHLGLTMAGESEGMKASRTVIEECCSIEDIQKTASSAPPLTKMLEPEQPEDPVVTIGVAMDAAFCFYYAENLRRLRARGAHLLFFSPITDSLPDVDALYIGGGYPELHMESLEHSTCRMQIARAADRGLPIYGECGGLIYLSRSCTTDSRTYACAGVLPADAEMKKRFQALGYVDGEIIPGVSPFNYPLPFRGHEFHYSALYPDSDCTYAFSLRRGRGIIDHHDGIVQENVIAGYTHIYFNDHFADEFIKMAKKERSE